MVFLGAQPTPQAHAHHVFGDVEGHGNSQANVFHGRGLRCGEGYRDLDIAVELDFRPHGHRQLVCEAGRHPGDSPGTVCFDARARAFPLQDFSLFALDEELDRPVQHPSRVFLEMGHFGREVAANTTWEAGSTDLHLSTQDAHRVALDLDRGERLHQFVIERDSRIQPAQS